jgi:hypothetical protein
VEHRGWHADFPGGYTRGMAQPYGDDGVDRPAPAHAPVAPLPRPARLPRPATTPAGRRTPSQDGTLLGKIETVFLRLPVTYPYLRIDGAAIGCGLPAQPVAPDEVRRVLMDEKTSFDEQDRAWRHLVTQARTAGPDWQIVALATALPGIKHQIRQREIFRNADVDAEIVCQFLDLLATIRLDRRNVCGRLIDTAIQRYRRQSMRSARPPNDHLVGQLSAEQAGDGLVSALDALAELNAAGHLGRDDARLIGYTRLVGLTIEQAATRLGLSISAATMRRTRAEEKIRTVLDHQRHAQPDRIDTPPRQRDPTRTGPSSPDTSPAATTSAPPDQHAQAQARYPTG